MQALLFSPSIRPNGHGSPSQFSLEISTSAQVTTAFRPTRPRRPSSSSRQATEAAARHRPKRRCPTHLRPPAHLPHPSTPPKMALPPHPLPSPPLPFPIPPFPPPLEAAPSIATGRRSSFPDPSLRRPGLYKAPRGSPNHATPLPLLLSLSRPLSPKERTPPPPELLSLFLNSRHAPTHRSGPERELR
jgi:hypothetical protein